MKTSIKIIIAIAAILLLWWLSYKYEYKPAKELSNDVKIDSLENIIKLTSDSIKDQSKIEIIIERENDSLEKKGEQQHEIFEDSIDIIKYLPIDDNIKLWTKLLSSEDSSFRRYIDSRSRNVPDSNKQDYIKIKDVSK